VGLPLTRQELEQRFLRRLVQARLVRATEVDGQTRYELTHEFLITQITTWIEASDRDRIKALEMLTRAYEVYQITGQLLSAQALEMIEPWQAQLVLPEGQQAFLTQSQRAGRRQRVTFWRNVAGAAACLVLLLLAGGGVWYWHAYQREHVDYYAQVITRWGLPEGVGRLTAEQVRQRNASLAFHKHGRRGAVHEVRLVNSRGAYHPVAFSAGYPNLSFLNPLSQETVDGVSEGSATIRVVFERDARGHILNQSAYNRAGRRIYTLHYVQPNMAEYKDEGITRVMRKSGVALLKFVRPESGPEAGLVQELRYFDTAGKPQPDHAGAYGYRFLFEERGLTVKVIGLGADGQPAVMKAGIATIAVTHDALGNLTQFAFFGRDGQALVNTEGVAGTKLAYDPSGNLQEVTFTGIDGQLVTVHNIGAAGKSFRYDARGNLVESTFFDLHRQPVTGRIGGETAEPDFAKQTVEWDEHGGSLETYFGPDGKPIVIEGRIVQTRHVWDALGYPVEMSFFDEHRRPIRDNDGCTKYRYTRDVHGSLIDKTCLDERDSPIRATDGWAHVKWVRDDRGNVIEESYFGPTGQPEHYDEPYVKTRFKYNAQGKWVECVYFDATDQPVKSREGYAKATTTYDLQGNMTEVAMFDAQDQPTRRQGNYAKILRTYNEWNQLTAETVYDPQGQPTRHENGHVTARFDYDQWGYRSATAYFDENNHPTLHTDGYTKVLKNHNDKGQLVEQVYVGLDGAYVLDKKAGFAKVRLTYNERGQVAQRMYFDPDERLVQTVYGYATQRYTYDDSGEKPCGRSSMYTENPCTRGWCWRRWRQTTPVSSMVCVSGISSSAMTGTISVTPAPFASWNS
jgi:YD repeat-containing protein